jgi:hypothetical protein
MTNTTPQPIPSVEEVVAAFDHKFYHDHEERGLTYLRNDVVGWLRTTLTARDAAHQEAMREMVREILDTAYFDDWECHVIDVAKVEAIARSRGVEDKE